MLEEKHGKLINLKPYSDDIGIADNSQQKCIKQLQDITGDGGLRLAHEAKYGLYQHCNKLFIAGTKDFPVDHTGDLKLLFGDILNKRKKVEMQMLTADLIMK